MSSPLNPAELSRKLQKATPEQQKIIKGLGLCFYLCNSLLAWRDGVPDEMIQLCLDSINEARRAMEVILG
jgi:hypothetical protein